MEKKPIIFLCCGQSGGEGGAEAQSSCQGEKDLFRVFHKKQLLSKWERLWGVSLIGWSSRPNCYWFKKQEKTKKDTTKSRVFFWRA